MKVSRTALATSTLPSLLMLGLFYSLALHMFQSLGGWPTSIGEAGFPAILSLHSNLTAKYFIVLLLLTVFVVPGALVTSLLVPRWRPSSLYFGWHIALFFLCWGLTQLAPLQFLTWWRD